MQSVYGTMPDSTIPTDARKPTRPKWGEKGDWTPITTKVPPDEFAALGAAVGQLGTTKSDLIREAVRVHLIRLGTLSNT